MEFRILGSLEVRDGDRLVSVAGGKQRTLLALLLLNANQTVSTDRIVEDLWGERAPRSAVKVVQNHVSRLRKALADGLLVTRGTGYMLELAPGQLDLDRFEELSEEGRGAFASGDALRAADLLRSALDLWRGPPLSEFRFAPFAQTEIARLDERRLAALEQLMEAELALGRHADMVAELEALVAAQPLRERLRAQLMLALYRSRRQADALAAYQDARRALVDELGIEPSLELQQLERSILRQDPALEPPVQQSARPSRGPDSFVGREREQAALSDGLDEALAGRGRLFLVSGEPGIGKSRLAEQFTAEARARGVPVLAGRCWEAGGAPAYWPWVQALRSYVRSEDIDVVRRHAGHTVPDLAQLLPELAELVADPPPPLSNDPEVARFRLFEAVTSFMKNAADDRGLLLFLDDLHVADTPSLLLLRFLARTLGDSRLLVIAAYRDVDPALKDPIAAATAELSREPVTRLLPLTGLVEDEVALLIERTTDVGTTKGVAGAIYEETEGNPLFVGEIVRLLLAEGALASTAVPTGWQGRIPEGVRTVILRRLGHVSERCSETLVFASVLGRDFDLEALERVTGLERDAILEILDEAARERLVTDIPAAAGGGRFAHALIRDTLYDSIPSGRRAQLERRIGEALEQLYESDIEPHLAELAHHFLAAIPAAGPPKAIDYARRAGDRAVALTAFEEAGRQYGLALDCASDEALRCDLLLSLGDAQARAGDTTAKATFLEAAELAERLGTPAQLARAALGYGGRIVWDVQRDDEYLRPLLERALRMIGEEDGPLRVRLLSRLAAGPLRDACFPPSRRHELSAQALELARRLGDPSTLAYALAASIAARHSPESTEWQVSTSTELIEIATLAREPERAIEGYDHCASALLELGDIDGAEAALTGMARLAEKLRQPSQAYYVAEVRAGLALLRGPLDEAERLIHASYELGRQVLEWNARFTHSIQLYFLRRHQGRLRELVSMFESEENEARYRTYPIWDCLVMRYDDELGRTDRARQQFELFAQTDFARLPFDEEWLVGMGLLAEQAASLNDDSRARTLYDLLVPYADRVATSYSEASTGSVSRYLGLLARTLSLREAATRHFEDALISNERLGARPWLAQTQEDYSSMLIESDPALASVLLEQAVSMYTALGMSACATRAAAAMHNQEPRSRITAETG